MTFSCMRDLVSRAAAFSAVSTGTAVAWTDAALASARPRRRLAKASHPPSSAMANHRVYGISASWLAPD